MREILLTQGKVALIDDEDFDLVSRYKWCAHKNGSAYYASTNIYKENKRAILKMHNLIMENLGVDHKNGDGLDNRRKNLRFCSQTENNRNRHSTWGVSKYKGVTWHDQSKKWRARIGVDKKYVSLGLFDNEITAAKVYNEAAIKYFGEFAAVNLLERGD